MTEDYAVSQENRVRQLREKASYDRREVHEILDSGLFAAVGFVQDGCPVVVPMIYGRDGDTIYLHGARKARVIRLLEQTHRVCLNVTHVDGLVIARSAFNSSMNYRSATVFGTPSLVEDRDGKLDGMRIISEHLMPGRWDELRAPLEREIKMTGVIAVTIESASAKVSAKMPDDEEEDYAIPTWAGVLPLTSRFGELQADDRVLDGVAPSAILRALQGRSL
ncbi:MAG TPA: pyridoxamine 5'-phosphate oxidase family protein [Woeseiaceae bacterium]|jgi:nitroimidazol reductase NimA-like FMN-containing flavoprotein (pyridoxamine 5'-phosphate oxidase superfamily)|nr:pyridoxamine 5'-phosphate oxidase family protein [Woeseiaceae bacterium]